MEPQRVEELLKQGLRKDPPERMRERILSRAIEGEKTAGNRFHMVWRLAFAALIATAVVVTTLCRISDSRRCSRLQALLASPADTRVAQAMSQLTQ